MTTQTVWIAVCTFTRYKGAQTEDGIAFGHHPGVSDIRKILDVHGHEVKDVWDYNLWPYKGSFTAELSDNPYAVKGA